MRNYGHLCHCERGTSVAIHSHQQWIATTTLHSWQAKLRKAPLLAMTATVQ